MDERRLKAWQPLFARALVLLDSAAAAGADIAGWTFGGGTVLMRRHSHRLSKDIDIFVGDPQVLGFLSPRLNPRAEALTAQYVEQGNFLKLFFSEGEIDFVASAPLTENPTSVEIIAGREIHVETSTEIIAKKVWHRGAAFKARDIFDLALVMEKEPQALRQIAPVLRERRSVVLDRVEANDAGLREAFAELEVLEYDRSYDECLTLIRQAFDL